MKLLVEMFEKKDYENTNELSDRKLKELFVDRIRKLFSEEDRNKVRIKVRLVKK